MRKNNIIQIRATTEQKQKLLKKAKEENMEVSDYVRIKTGIQKCKEVK